MANDEDDLSGIERILGYQFFERQHLVRALTHPAYANELLQQNTRCMDQEAYSTLGDAVLKTSFILFLMEKGFNTKGEITQEKEDLESNVNLARIGLRLKIRTYIRLGRGAKDLWRSGEETILADTLEALVGAIFLDSDAGLGIVRQCIGKWFEPELKKSGIRPSDRISPARKTPNSKVSSRKGTVQKVPLRKIPETKVPVPKNEGQKTRRKVPLVPQPLSPLPSSSRREVPRGKKSVLRQPWMK